jgi:hypothetical protein
MSYWNSVNEGDVTPVQQKNIDAQRPFQLFNKKHPRGIRCAAGRLKAFFPSGRAFQREMPKLRNRDRTMTKGIRGAEIYCFGAMLARV